MLISPCPYCHFRHPQRQENAGFAAAVARGVGAKWPERGLARDWPVPGLPQRQENAGFAAVVARSVGAKWPERGLARDWPVPGLPQRQENAGFAAVVARDGEGRRPGWLQIARCGEPMMKPGAIWNDGISWSFLPERFRRPHPGDFPHGEEGRQGIDRKHDCGHY